MLREARLREVGGFVAFDEVDLDLLFGHFEELVDAAVDLEGAVGCVVVDELGHDDGLLVAAFVDDLRGGDEPLRAVVDDAALDDEAGGAVFGEVCLGERGGPRRSL